MWELTSSALSGSGILKLLVIENVLSGAVRKDCLGIDRVGRSVRVGVRKKIIGDEKMRGLEKA